MCHAILSPIYKDKGSKDDRAMYRPISVTTIPYRILAKCIAQKLSLAMPTLIEDPQVGHCPGRNYDENVRLVRQVIHDVNRNRPDDGGIMLCLDNAKAFDRLQSPSPAPPRPEISNQPGRERLGPAPHIATSRAETLTSCNNSART